jgi:hypothetical protein
MRRPLYLVSIHVIYLHYSLRRGKGWGGEFHSKYRLPPRPTAPIPTTNLPTTTQPAPCAPQSDALHNSHSANPRPGYDETATSPSGPSLVLNTLFECIDGITGHLQPPICAVPTSLYFTTSLPRAYRPIHAACPPVHGVRILCSPTGTGRVIFVNQLLQLQLQLQ